MKKNKVLHLTGAFLMVGLFLSSNGAKALDIIPPPPPMPEETSNENVTVMATVNIYSPKIVSQDQNRFKVSFDISNREGVQPEIKYAIHLVKKGKIRYLMDEKVYDEVVTLGENQTVHKEIEYTAPDFLSGDYELWVNCDNEKSLPLGQGKAGEVLLEGNNQYVEIDNATCNITIEGKSDKKYLMAEGADVSVSQKLNLRCDLVNHSDKEITFTPKFETYYRSTSGKKTSDVEVIEQPALTLKSQEKRNFYFTIPKARVPQAYDAKLMLFSDSKIISNSIVAHYVIQGASATIQNITLDKDYYKSGDIAKISFFWTGSADVFPESSNQDNFNIKTFFEISITNELGERCNDQKKESISVKNPGNTGIEKFDVGILKDCTNPKVDVTIKDGQGNILDQEIFEVKSKLIESVSNPEEINKNLLSKKALVYLFALIITIILIGMVVWSYKRKKYSGLSIFLFIIVSTFFFSYSFAQADTYTVSRVYPDGCASDAIFAIGISTTSLNPGGIMTASGRTLQRAWCSNGTSASKLLARINGVDGWLAYWDTDSGGYESGTFGQAVQNSCGDFSVGFIGMTYGITCAACASGCHQHGLGWGNWYMMNYSVTGCCYTPTCNISATTPVLSGQNSTITYSSNGSTCWGGLSGGTGGWIGNNGTRSVGPITANTAYNLTCYVNGCNQSTYNAFCSAPINLAAVCGNGIVESGEGCDDGNLINTDACTNACNNAICGDGFVRSGVEQCDLGSGNNINCPTASTCSATCTNQACTNNLSVTKTGTGSVSSAPAGISCGGTCNYAFPFNASVALNPTASAPWAFNSWSGDCSGSGACNVLMNGDKSVGATFICTPSSYTYNCDTTSPSCASLPCGSTAVGTALCRMTDNCGGSSYVPIANCLGCSADTISCPPCVEGWKEVQP